MLDNVKEAPAKKSAPRLRGPATVDAFADEYKNLDGLKLMVARRYLQNMIDGVGEQVTASVVDLTRELAYALLERNDVNRTLKEKPTQRIMNDLRSKQFWQNGASIVVMSDGSLGDGQHRSVAVLRTGIPIPRQVLVFGVEPKARQTMDQNVLRSTADFLGFAGHNYTSLLAAAGLILAQYDRGLTMWGKNPDISKSDIQAAVDRHPDLEPIIAYYGASRGARTVSPSLTVLIISEYLIAKSTKHEPERVRSFFDQLVSGEMLGGRSPILYARNRLIAKTDRDMLMRAECVVKAWNAWIKGETPKQMMLTGNLPKIL